MPRLLTGKEEEKGKSRRPKGNFAIPYDHILGTHNRGKGKGFGRKRITAVLYVTGSLEVAYPDLGKGSVM